MKNTGKANSIILAINLFFYLNLLSLNGQNFNQNHSFQVNGRLHEGHIQQQTRPGEVVGSESEYGIFIIELKSPALAPFMNPKNRVSNSELISLEKEIKSEQTIFMDSLNNIIVKGPSQKNKKFESDSIDLSMPSVQICLNACIVKIPRALVSEIKKMSSVKNVVESRYEKMLNDYEIGNIYKDTLVDQAKSPAKKRSNFTGQGVKIGVLDTGVDYNHPDLGGGFGAGFKVYGGYDFHNNDDDPMDDEGHGTRVTGIAAANGDEYIGVAPDAEILAVKVLGADGSGYTFNIVYGLEYCLNPDGNINTLDQVDIVNMSGGSMFWPIMGYSTMTAINNVIDAGITVVVAASNDGPLFRTLSEQAMAVKAITVGASDNAGNVADFSSRGSTPFTQDFKPEVCAPGVDIIAPTLGGGYHIGNGTSRSAPYAAGIAALLIEKYPYIGNEKVKNLILNSSIGEPQPFIKGLGVVTDICTDYSSSVYPSKINLGLVDPSKMEEIKEIYLKISNEGDVVRIFNLNDTIQNNVTITFTPSIITIEPHSYDSVKVVFQFNNSLIENNVIDFEIYNCPLTPETAPQWIPHAGFLKITDGEDMHYKIAYSFIKSPSVLFSTENMISPIIFIHDTLPKEEIFENEPDFLRTGVHLNYVFEDLNRVLLNDGTYNFIGTNIDGNWNLDFSQIGIIEQYHVNRTDSINFSNEFFDQQTTIYNFDEMNNLIQESDIELADVRMILTHKRTGLSLATRYFTPISGKTFQYKISNNYYWQWSSYLLRNENRKYHFKGEISTISTKTEKNVNSDLKKIVKTYDLAFQSDTIVSIGYWINSPNMAALEYARSIEGPDYTEILYTMKDPSLEWTNRIIFSPYTWVAKNHINIWTWGFDYELHTPWINYSDNDDLRFFHRWENDQPALIVSTDTIKYELGPACFNPATLHNNLNLEYKTNSYRGYTDGFGGVNAFFPFVVNQFGDSRVYSDLWFKIYNEDLLLIDEGKFIDRHQLRLLEEKWFDHYCSIDLPYAGDWYLSTESGYRLSDTIGKLNVIHHMNTLLEDKDPPIVTFVQIKANNLYTNRIYSYSNNYIIFKTIDESALQQVMVKLRFLGDSIWTNYNLNNNDSIYELELPIFDRDGYFEMEIFVKDIFGNYNQQNFSPAFHYSNVMVQTIAASSTGNGSINPTGDIIVIVGGDQTFSITPNTGYEIADVLVDGISVGAVGSYTFSNVIADHTISASFSDCLKPDNAGEISGSTIVCQGSNSVAYTVPAIANATSYVWTLPNGASGTSTSNSITVDFGSEATSGEISVKGVNNCGEGEAASLFVQVNPLPEAATSLSGAAVVCAGAANIVYSTPAIAYADSYNWTLPPGFFGVSTTNSISVYFGDQALSGTITVNGVNNCGEGAAASLFVQVNPLPEQTTIPIGPDWVDLKNGNETVYKIQPVPNALTYFWQLEPVSMGVASSMGDSTVIIWSGQLGAATLKVRGWNSNCGFGPWSEVKNIWVDNTIGIDETGINRVTVFPNPSQGIFTVKSQVPVESLLLKDAAGKTVLRPKLVDSYQIDVDANAFAKGIYFLEITHGYGKERVKLVLY